MGKLQILLLVLLALTLVAVMIATWGSIGSAMCAMCLLLMGAALLYRRFVLDRDSDDFKMEL